MRRFVGLATVLGVLGIAGGSQVAGATTTAPAVNLCEAFNGTYATFNGGYTCTRTAGFFSSQQYQTLRKVCLNVEGGTLTQLIFGTQFICTQ